jgi:tetratricopeptide (TPR) repeat protein
MDGTLVTPDSAFIAEISWATLGTYMGVGIRQPSDLRVLHHEARAWLEPKKKLRDVGVESGDHIVCVFGKGLSATLDQLVDGFSRALALLESSGQRGGGEAQPSVERRLLDEAGDLIDVGRIDDARRVLDKVRGMPEGQPLAWYFTGRCCQEEGDMKQALACFRHALELKPSYPAALVEVGYCLNDLGRPADAIPNFIRALELDPDFHLAIVNAGVSHEQLGDLDRALACYEAALDRDPLNPHARQNKGSVLLRMGRVAEAAECFRDVLRLSASKQFQALAREGLARCSR